MKSILNRCKISRYTYFFLFICFIVGYIKEIIIIFVIVVWHELGHAIISYFYGYEILEIKIYPFGGITKVNKRINSPINSDIIIYLGGIIAQILFVFIIFGLYIFKIIDFDLLHMLFYYNKLIIIFNLLIIYPLDGFFIAKCFLEKVISFYWSNIFMILISIIFLISFSFFSVYNYHNYTIIFFLLYEIFLYIMNIRIIYNRFLLERYLYKLKFKRIKYNYTPSLKLLKKDYYHFFKQNNKIINEKALLSKKFDINKRF